MWRAKGRRGRFLVPYPFDKKAPNGWARKILGIRGLSGAEVDESGEEESRQDVEEPFPAAQISAYEMDDGPCDDAEAEAVGDRISQRDEDEGEEGGDGDEGLVPGDLRDSRHHERSNQDQGWRCGGNRDHADERHGDDGAEKENAGDDGGD